MSDMCGSTFTIDRRTGEKLTCDRTDHWGTHGAKYSGIRWYWHDFEEDRE